MSITYRAGRKEDCSKLAELVYMASDGVVEFLFRGLTPGWSPQQIMARNLEKDGGHYTYKNAIVAEKERKVVGASFFYPSRYHVISDEMRQFYPAYINGTQEQQCILLHCLQIQPSPYLSRIDRQYKGRLVHRGHLHYV